MIEDVLPWKLLEADVFIDLEKSLFCGQVFQFYNLGSSIFIGNIFDEVAILKQSEKNVYFLSLSERIEDYLKTFFNLSVKTFESDHLIELNNTGLRFLTNQLNSTIFSFICSSNNNIKRISKMVKFLYSYGDVININFDRKANDLNKFEKTEIKKFHNMIESEYLLLSNFLKIQNIHKFPHLNRLVDIEPALKVEKFGYRSCYITNAAKYLLEAPSDLTQFSENDLRIHLMKIKGIGRKIADCILLISMKMFNVVPIDVHIARYSKKFFKIDFKSLNDRVYNQIQNLWMQNFGECAGIIQLHIFNNEVTKKSHKTSFA